MVSKKTAGVYDINISGVFAIKEIFSAVKDLVEKYDYIFTEKGQEFKPNQYGEQIKFSMHGSRKLDDFADSVMDIDFAFSDCSSVKANGKKMTKGKLRVKIKFVVRYDYENKWQQSFFLEKLFNFYLTYLAGDRLKDKYFKPIAIDGSKFYADLKSLLDLYT